MTGYEANVFTERQFWLGAAGDGGVLMLDVIITDVSSVKGIGTVKKGCAVFEFTTTKLSGQFEVPVVSSI